MSELEVDSSDSRTSKPLNLSTDVKKIGFFKYYWVKMKSLCSKKKEDSFVVIEKMQEFNKKILNEATIYKLFIEVEKLKLFFLNSEQKVAFENIKLNYRTLFLKRNKTLDLHEISQSLQKNNTALDRSLVSFLRKY